MRRLRIADFELSIADYGFLKNLRPVSSRRLWALLVPVFCNPLL